MQCHVDLIQITAVHLSSQRATVHLIREVTEMCLFYNNEGKEVCYHRDIYKSRPKNDINVQRSRVTIFDKEKSC